MKHEINLLNDQIKVQKNSNKAFKLKLVQFDNNIKNKDKDIKSINDKIVNLEEENLNKTNLNKI